MNVCTFAMLDRRGKQDAVTRYWREALSTLAVDMGAEVNEAANKMALGKLAENVMRLDAEVSDRPWLFNLHGERVA